MHESPFPGASENVSEVSRPTPSTLAVALPLVLSFTLALPGASSAR